MFTFYEDWLPEIGFGIRVIYVGYITWNPVLFERSSHLCELSDSGVGCEVTKIIYVANEYLCVSFIDSEPGFEFFCQNRKKM